MPVLLVVHGNLDNDTRSGTCHLIMVHGNVSAADNRAKPVKVQVYVDHFSEKLASVLCVLTKELRADNDRSRRRVFFCNEDRPIGYMKTGETAY